MTNEFVPFIMVPVENKEVYEKLAEERNALFIQYEENMKLLNSINADLFNCNKCNKLLEKQKESINNFLLNSTKWIADGQQFRLSIKLKYKESTVNNFYLLEFKIIWDGWVNEMKYLNGLILSISNAKKDSIMVFKGLRIAYYALALTTLGVIVSI